MGDHRERRGSLNLRVLGPIEASLNGVPVKIPGVKPLALLGALIIHAGEYASADSLADALWGDRPPASSAATVRTYIAQLRRALGSEVMASGAAGYSLQVEPPCIDARVFEQQVTSARLDLASDREGAAARLRDALALWRGTAFGALGSEAFARAEVQRLEELRWAALEDRIDADLACHRHVALTGELQRLVAAQPLRERLQGQLVLALYRSGRQAEALRAYESFRRWLGDELGLEPAEELRSLERAVLAHDPNLRPPDLVTRPDHNLPAAMSPFIGRADELAAVGKLIAGSRVVTLVGPGGCGTTRLALELASQLVGEYADGVWVAELAPLVSDDHVVSAVAGVWGVEDTGTGDLMDQVCRVVRDRSLLLVLDNCEHVLDAAAVVTGRLLRSAPRVRILATSREPLGVDGETSWVVPSLGLPSGDAGSPSAVGAADAVRLFLDRAARARPGFTLTAANAPSIVEICRRLDGIPLAIELAAARVRSLMPEEIAARLDERFTLLVGGPRTALPRHRTLRALTDWSWDLLSHAERILFCRLAVFSGGCTLEAARAVCAHEGLRDSDVLALTPCLVDKSLVIADQRGHTTRFRMLETLRQYAEEKLAVAGQEASVRDRHLRWMVSSAEEGGPALAGPEQEWWSRAWEFERDNIRTALTWALQSGQAEAGLKLAGVQRVWQLFGALSEGRSWLDRFLVSAPDAAPETRARALEIVGYLAFLQGDRLEAKERLVESLGLCRTLGVAEATSRVLLDLGQIALAEKDFKETRKLFTESLEWAKRSGKDARIGLALTWMADLAFDEGQLDQSKELGMRALNLLRAAGDRHTAGGTLLSLGRVARSQGDAAAARQYFGHGLAQLRGICKVCTESSLFEYARILTEEGETTAAEPLLAERELLRAQLGYGPAE